MLRSLFEEFETADLASVLGRLITAPLETEAALKVPDPASAWKAAILNALRQFASQAQVAAAIADLRGLHGPALVGDAGDKLAFQIEALLHHWEQFELQLSVGNAFAAAVALYQVRHDYRPGNVGKRTSRAKDAARAFCELYDEVIQPWLGGKEKGDPAPDPDAESRVARLVPLLAEVFKRAQALYQTSKDQRQALDFDDLEGKAVALLQVPEIRARWQKQIAALMVDEFQDTNGRQRQIVEALAGTQAGISGRLFVVGDAKQSIYRFRGADVTVFREMSRAIEARGGRGLELNRTYRAHPGLVESVNELMAVIMGTAQLTTHPYRVPFAPLTADRKKDDARLPEPYVEFICGLGENAGDARPAAAQLLAERLRQLHDHTGMAWDDVALLFRASTAFPVYEDALEAVGIPFVTVAGRGFYDRPEIRDTLNMLRALADPWDDAALAGLLRSPAFGLSDVALYQLRWPTGTTEPQNLRAALNGDLAAPTVCLWPSCSKTYWTRHSIRRCSPGTRTAGGYGEILRSCWLTRTPAAWYS